MSSSCVKNQGPLHQGGYGRPLGGIEQSITSMPFRDYCMCRVKLNLVYICGLSCLIRLAVPQQYTTLRHHSFFVTTRGLPISLRFSLLFDPL